MTQEYTPVEWVDETPNQQGTLINKERLDQMQSAHHFADGFKEVDTVPTDAPEGDYHQIVFCTADNSIYRWNGSQWNKDIDGGTAAELAAHEADHDNPHVVTKDQVGLGNVDNTSDADKPVSTAQQTALNGKVDKNASITGATKTKITYDAKGLVTAGADLADTDIPALAISKITGLQTVLDGKAPTSHASTSTTYGEGDATHYGHVIVDASMNAGSANPVRNSTIVSFVNSSIATATAYFRGTYNAVTDLGFTQAQVDAWSDPPSAATETAVSNAIKTKLTALGITPTNNDYVFISVSYSATIDVDFYWRFKYDGTDWLYEYTLNNSSFTQAQWNTINALITNTTVDPNDPTNTPYQGIDVKDILAHIASSANPHLVTKAQIGLGNVDNYGTVSAWQVTPDNTHIPSEKLVKDTLDTKVAGSQIVSSWSATTTNTNIPSEKLVKDTLGDYVTLNTAQYITAIKHFKKQIVLNGTNGSDDPYIYYLSDNPRIVSEHNNRLDIYNDHLFQIKASDAQLTEYYNMDAYRRGTSGLTELHHYLRNKNGGETDFNIIYGDDGVGYMRGPYRGYNAANTADLVTIGSLQASTDVVHRTGVETVGGAKTFTTAPIVENTFPQFYLDNSADDYTVTTVAIDTMNYIAFRDKNNAITAHISEYVYNGGRGLSISLFDKSSGSVKEANIGLVAPKNADPYTTATSRTTPSATNEILTLSNGVTLNTAQTITGAKTITNYYKFRKTASGQSAIQVETNLAWSSGSQLSPLIDLMPASNRLAGRIYARQVSANESDSIFEVYHAGSYGGSLVLHKGSDGFSAQLTSTRAYSGSNNSDLLTIGSLKATQLKNQYNIVVTRCGPMVQVSIANYDHHNTSEHQIFTDLPTAKSYAVGELTDASNNFNGGAWISAGTKILKCQQKSATPVWGSFIYFTDE